MSTNLNIRQCKQFLFTESVLLKHNLRNISEKRPKLAEIRDKYKKLIEEDHNDPLYQTTKTLYQLILRDVQILMMLLLSKKIVI